MPAIRIETDTPGDADRGPITHPGTAEVAVFAMVDHDRLALALGATVRRPTMRRTPEIAYLGPGGKDPLTGAGRPLHSAGRPA
jgi:hypothetical protein